jgi:hypothetical protein
VVVHTYNLSTQEAEAGGLQVWDLNLSHIVRLLSQINKQTNKQKPVEFMCFSFFFLQYWDLNSGLCTC